MAYVLTAYDATHRVPTSPPSDEPPIPGQAPTPKDDPVPDHHPKGF